MAPVDVVFLCAAIAFSGYGQSFRFWPKASPDNGYAYYLAAGSLAESPDWRGFRSGMPKKKGMQVLRQEAAHADDILAQLKKGNALPVYDPQEPETLITLHPEYAAFKKVVRIACDVAYVKAADGDKDAASQWLVQADRFVGRLPTPTMFSLLVNDAMKTLLRQTTLEFLPCLGLAQLKEQLGELEAIADHPSDVEATCKSDLEAMDRSINQIVADPTILGLPDEEVPDITASFGKLMEGWNGLSPALSEVIEKIMRSAPDETQKDDVAGLKYLAASEPQVPVPLRGEFHKFLEDMQSVIQPSKYKLSDYAKSLDPASKAHAALIIRLACETTAKSMMAAFQRPERSWWIAWRRPPDETLTDQMTKDGRQLRFLKVDMFALQISQVIGNLSGDSGDPETEASRVFLLGREKARLAVVDAKIWAFDKVQHRLPTSLKQIGNPVDPLSRRPYSYRRTSSTTYELAAVGVPGIEKIDADTKLSQQDPARR